ncbi:Fic family protein [Myxococcota bacterium]|nr:Fic family protein [Myxococcota bacterium]
MLAGGPWGATPRTDEARPRDARTEGTRAGEVGATDRPGRASAPRELDVRALPLAPTRAADRTRTDAARALIPPVLAPVMTGLLERMITDVRAGRAGFAADDRGAVYGQLASMDPAQRTALRKLLVTTPPHPRLREIQRDEALTGPPTPAALMRIASGELFGTAPEPSTTLAARAHQLVDVLGKDWSPEDRAAWVDALGRSDAAVRIVEREGLPGMVALSRFPTSLFDELGRSFGLERQLASLCARGDATVREVQAHLATHGTDATVRALSALEELRWGNVRDALVDRVGFARAAQLAAIANANVHGVRALRHLRGDEGLVAAATAASPKAFEATLADAAARIHSFGSGNVALETGASWPPEGAPRTVKITRAEGELAAKVHVEPSAVASTSPSDPRTRSTVIRAMKDVIRAKSPALAAQLERELAGRRFVAGRYYDALYAAGVKNPEHRYSVETFDSWSRADALVRAKAKETRGRPLAKGELVAIAQAVHREAAAGMLGVGESHMKSGDAGRLRARDADHVQLGDMFQQMSAEASALLDKNPYLSPDQLRMPLDDGRVTRSVHFAKGSDVPRMMDELDAWVRANEGKLPAAELAAEVHFRMVSIHPFMDGNGRTSKLMADLVLARAGVEAPVWRKGDVLVNHREWPAAVEEGVAFTHATVERYFRAAVELDAPKPQPPEVRG